MKKPITIIFFALVLTPAAFADNAWLEQVKGDVQIQQKGQAWSLASSGAHVEAGDQIKTGPKASVIVHLQKADVSLYENTEFKVNEYSTAKDGMKAELNLILGHLQARVKKLDDKEKLEVVTPTNVAAVRGTTLDLLTFILNTKNYTRLVMTDGKVKFCTKSGLVCVIVKEGEYATGDADNILGPKTQQDTDNTNTTNPSDAFQDQNGFDQQPDHAQEDPSQFNPPKNDNKGSGGGGGGGGEP